jgi:cyanophycinase
MSREADILSVPQNPKGSLVIIGGRENKDGHRPILEQVASRITDGKLVVATLASEDPDEQWQTYRRVFTELGVGRVEHLRAETREELVDSPPLELLEGAEVLFFAGGDQMKITSKFGGTVLCERMRELYRQGATIAGTSSGASAMSETMMVSGEGTGNVSETLRMAPGLALVPGLIIDQHFAERGRMGRLLAAVGQNPRLIGVGIDENTAIVMNEHSGFSVLGSGAVYVVDGRAMTFSNAAEELPAAPSLFGLTVHVLSSGDCFYLEDRKPVKCGRAE